MARAPRRASIGLRNAVFLAASALNVSSVILRAAHPEAFMHPISMIRFYGYRAELHRVSTPDGYVLELHRIPGRHGRLSVPVVVQHGIGASSADFLANRPPDNLASQLWNHGYDVWLSNTRGNRYTGSHIKYNVRDPRFWDFSIEEFAKYDLPTVVAYVQRATNYRRLHYIGHSQGSQSMFALLATQPSFGHNLRLFSAMAPVASVAHTTSPFIWARPLLPLLKATNPSGRLRSSDFNLIAPLCQLGWSSQWMCSYITDVVHKPNRKNQDRQRADVYYSHFPCDTSLKNVEHMVQLHENPGFRKFDYGVDGNLLRYGSPWPPDYELSRIRDVRIALYFGRNDNIVEKTDADFLLRKLQADVVFDVFTVPDDPQFTHNDFMWGTQSKSLVWNRIIQNMKKVDQIEDSIPLAHKRILIGGLSG